MRLSDLIEPLSVEVAPDIWKSSSEWVLAKAGRRSNTGWINRSSASTRRSAGATR